MRVNDGVRHAMVRRLVLEEVTLSPAADDRVESSYFVAGAAIFSRNFAISSRFGP